MRVDVTVMQSLENLHQSRRRVSNNDVEQMRFQKDLNAARHRLRSDGQRNEECHTEAAGFQTADLICRAMKTCAASGQLTVG
jgi:hypothetical protein